MVSQNQKSRNFTRIMDGDRVSTNTPRLHRYTRDGRHFTGTCGSCDVTQYIITVPVYWYIYYSRKTRDFGWVTINLEVLNNVIRTIYNTVYKHVQYTDKEDWEEWSDTQETPVPR